MIFDETTHQSDQLCQTQVAKAFALSTQKNLYRSIEIMNVKGMDSLCWTIDQVKGLGKGVREFKLGIEDAILYGTKPRSASREEDVYNAPWHVEERRVLTVLTEMFKSFDHLVVITAYTLSAQDFILSLPNHFLPKVDKVRLLAVSPFDMAAAIRRFPSISQLYMNQSQSLPSTSLNDNDLILATTRIHFNSFHFRGPLHHPELTELISMLNLNHLKLTIKGGSESWLTQVLQNVNPCLKRLDLLFYFDSNALSSLYLAPLEHDLVRFTQLQHLTLGIGRIDSNFFIIFFTAVATSLKSITFESGLEFNLDYLIKGIEYICPTGLECIRFRFDGEGEERKRMTGLQYEKMLELRELGRGKGFVVEVEYGVVK